LADLRKRFTSSLVNILLTTPVLGILLKLQRTLDPLDIEGLSKLWQLSKSDATPIGSNIPELTLNDWTNFLNTYLVESKSLHGHDQADLLDTSTLLYHLHAYILSAIFKDCSIIVRLPHLRNTSQLGSAPIGTLTIIDLDPKPMKNLQKWEELDREIAEEYMTMKTEDRHRCIDSTSLSESIKC
jgi:inositol-pentakisphosphate 2-kinase